MSRFRLGAHVTPSGVRFRVFAPEKNRMELVVEGRSERVPMTVGEHGVFECELEGASAGLRYRFAFDGAGPFPDPASRYQPDGVHEASAVVDPSTYAWQDGDWNGVALHDLTIYELHVGTFSPEGTFAGATARLDALADLGVSAIELMPVHDFPGRWNWGYDPAAFWAPSHAYGSPDDLRALVDAAHARGIAVLLDVVYNHLGPDGAYVAGYAPMLTETHHTPWGPAVNLDGEYSEGVRAFFIENALHWLEEYHVDGLRLDATFALIDDSDEHFLSELERRAREVEGPRRLLIAEDGRNRADLVWSRDRGGFGLDAQWTDDLHHLIRVYLAGDEHGYYEDYPASTEAIATTIEQGWYYTGQKSPHWGKPRGTPPEGVQPEQCVVCIQNHDQIGNRPFGDRLHHEISAEAWRAASALLLFLPQTPLLFMGQEWAASTPFQFFTDHNARLGAKVSEGRREEFKAFPGFSGEVPDPQSPSTRDASRLRWEERDDATHAGVLQLYRDLLQRRAQLTGPARARAAERGVIVERDEVLLAVALEPSVSLPVPQGASIVWSTEDPRYVEDVRPPEMRETRVFFHREGAAWLTV